MVGHGIAPSDGVAPIITKAFRAGAIANPKQQGPRVTVATLQILEQERKFCKKHAPEVFSNLRSIGSPSFLIFFETLQKKEHKPVTTKLFAANIKYRWITPLKPQERHYGCTYYAEDKDSGYKLLQTLQLESQE